MDTSRRPLPRRCFDQTHTLTRANGDYGVQGVCELFTTSDILARSVADYVTEGELPATILMHSRPALGLGGGGHPGSAVIEFEEMSVGVVEIDTAAAEAAVDLTGLAPHRVGEDGGAQLL